MRRIVRTRHSPRSGEIHVLQGGPVDVSEQGVSSGSSVSEVGYGKPSAAIVIREAVAGDTDRRTIGILL